MYFSIIYLAKVAILRVGLPSSKQVLQEVGLGDYLWRIEADKGPIQIWMLIGNASFIF